MSSSSARPSRGDARGAARTAAALLVLLCLMACASTSRNPRPAPPSASNAAGAATAQRGAGVGAKTETRAEEFPTEALDLLAKSEAESCAICAGKLRKEAFTILDDAYRPGTILRAEADSRLLLAPGGENELTLTAYHRTAPALAFRFHTISTHLVGIAEGDFTDPAVAEQLLSAPPGAAWHGLLQVVAYAYGDGATYLYSRAGNRLQVHCKVVSLSAD